MFYSEVDKRFYQTHSDPDRNQMAFTMMHAAAIMPDDISDIEPTVILEEVLGYARPRYNLRNAFRQLRSDKLTLRVDIATNLEAHEKVEPMEEADITASDWETVSFDLWKNVAHVVMADESGKRAAHDIMGLHVADCAKALLKSENEQCATILEGGDTTGAGDDWGGSNNPYDNIIEACDSIEGTGGFEPNLIVAHPFVWMDFFGNDFVKGQLAGEVIPMGQSFPIPGLAGWTGLKDYALTNTIAIVIDKDQFAGLCLGPLEAAPYRKESAGYDAYIVRQWLEPKRLQELAAYRLTAVHA